MKKALLIAEKPSLMRDIQKAYNVVRSKLSFDIEFTALRGHFMELQEPESYDSKWGKPWKLEALPIIPDKFKFDIKKSCKKDYSAIKSMINSGKYDFVINACDAGREGQAIFWTFYEHCGAPLPVKRLWASDTTTETLGKALGNLLDSSEPHLRNMKDASFYRMYFDWLLGMNLSRATSLKTSKTIPVGRVMTPTLNIVVMRDLEILNFVPKNYYEVEGDFEKYKGMWFQEVEDLNDKTKKKTITSFEEKAKAQSLIDSLGKTAKVTSVEQENVRQNAPALHSLSELQKDANKAYGFTASQTLDLAQSLYEKHKILSYPRTSSRALSTSMAKEIHKHLEAIQDVPDVQKYVKNILGDKKRIDSTMSSKKYVDNKKITDHHAIIPTQLKPNLSALSDMELKLYILVVKKFVAIFLDPYITNKTTIITNVDKETFKTTGSVLVDMGYRELYGSSKSDDEIPAVKKGDILPIKGFNILEKTTTPPYPYNDSSLVEAMQNAGKFTTEDELKEILKDSEGLGTEATRAGIIEKLIEKNMFMRKGKTIRATEFGFKIIEVLGGKDIISPELTAQWEGKLRDIEEGSYNKSDFYKEMIKYVLSETDAIIKNLNTKLSSMDTKEAIGKCPKCSSNVVVTEKYYICQDYKKSCDFVFGKTIGGTNITKTEAIKIISKKPTKKMKFKKKAGGTFEAQIIYDDHSGKVTYYFGEKSTATNEILGKCPSCGSNVVHKGSYCSCEKYKDSCNFAISFTINNANLETSDIEALLEGKETEEKTFKWKSGKTGQAKLKYNKEENKLEFMFKNVSNKVIGACPSCSNDVFDRGTYCKCSNSDCKFSLGYTISGAKLSEKDIKDLLKGKETEEKTFKWKSGKTGQAKLKYNKEENKLEFMFKNVSNKVIGACPSCSNDVFDRGTYCKCSNSDCKFSLGYTISGAKLSEKDIKDLLKGKETKEKTFKWNSGKTGQAKLQYASDKLKFIFINNKK